MYLRTKKRKNKDGTTVEYYQLAHNERHSETGKPVAKIIHNFGRADRLDHQELVRLCHSIARVCGLIVTDPLEQPRGSAGIGFADDLKIKQTLVLGCPMVIEALWERLGLRKTLQDIESSAGARIPYERALMAMVPTGYATRSPSSASGIDGCPGSICLPVPG